MRSASSRDVNGPLAAGQTRSADPEPAIAAMIDVDRYPVHALGSPRAQMLIADCRMQLAARGSCALDGFLTAHAIAAAAEEAHMLAPLAHRTPNGHSTAYLEPPDESYPERHPKRRLQRTSVGAVAYDLFPPNSLIRRLYEWDGLLAFLAIVLRKPKVWRYADPLGALNLAVMVDGDELLWHFDQTDFVVSLMLQRSLRGGDFEYVPYIRNAIEPNFLRVQRLLEGDRSDIITLDLAPGTLALFEGRYSIHRVGPVEGSKPRVIALLGYDTKPGTVSSDLLKQRRYGRVG
jgi:hypothetical protein